MAALQRVDPELYEAAELDGANGFQRFRAVTISIIRPEVYVVGPDEHDRGAEGLRLAETLRGGLSLAMSGFAHGISRAWMPRPPVFR